MMLVWPCISIERDSYWSWIPRTSSSQCSINPVLVPPSKPPDTLKDIYDGLINYLKTRVDIRTRMYVVPVEHGNFSQTFQFKMWFFEFITCINFKWDYMLRRIITLLVWICHRTKLRIYKVTQTQSDALVEDGLLNLFDLYGKHL